MEVLKPAPVICQFNCEDCQNAEYNSGSCQNESSKSIFAEETPAVLTAEQATYKRGIYEKMNPRRRKFIDRLGYDNWNPFQAPNDPLDIRKDLTKRTIQELVRDFMAQSNGTEKDAAWKKGALECAMGIMKKDERYQGIFDFCLWYRDQLQKEGLLQ